MYYHDVGPESRNVVPACYVALAEASRRHQSANSTPIPTHRRKSSTESFREIETHQSTFSVRRSTTRQRLSTTTVPKDHSLGRVSRSTLSSQSSNRSSVSGYYSQESDASLLSECDTPKEISVFDSFGPGDVTSPIPSSSRSRRHDAWAATKPTPTSTSMDCPAHGNCESGDETNMMMSLDGGSLVATWPQDRKCNCCPHIPGRKKKS